MPNIPASQSLYNKVKSEVKARVNKWPSAYASGQVVSEYKKRGGTYTTSTHKSKDDKPLKRWYDEKWINVKTDGPCGRKSATSSRSPYPYCIVHSVAAEHSCD